MSKPYIAVIMAGGSGTRLWPLSRKAKPKQFYAFLSEKTLLQETYDRAASVVAPEHIFISTNEEFVELVKKQLPSVPSENLLTEPSIRNTGPAILLVASLLEKRFPGCLVATVAADHAIGNPEEYTALLKASFLAAEKNEAIVTMGINPTRPDTGLGYIKMNGEAGSYGERRAFFIEAFKEKPDQKTAEEYLRSFDYLWNAGYFTFQAKTLLLYAKKYAPEIYEGIEKITSRLHPGELSPEAFKQEYEALESIPFDTMVMEKLAVKERMVIPAALEWSDIGNWDTLSDFLVQQKGGSVVESGKTFDLGSDDLFVHGNGRLIATLGLENIVIVDTPDALLVARKDRVGSDIKKLLEDIKKKKDLEKLL